MHRMGGEGLGVSDGRGGGWMIWAEEVGGQVGGEMDGSDLWEGACQIG